MQTGEVYFLSHWYERNISDFEVYEKFIEKHLLSSGKKRTTIGDIQRTLKEQQLEIPATIIYDVLQKLCGSFPEDLLLVNDLLEIRRIPKSLESFFVTWQEEFKSDSRYVADKFNAFLERNKRKSLSFPEFQKVLAELQDSFLYSDGIELAENLSDEAKILFDYIHHAFNSAKKEGAQEKLSRILHAVLVYTYYTSSEIQTNFIQSKTVYFDTNVLIYLLGANLDFRRTFVTELLSLLADLGIEFRVATCTLLELRRILESPPNMEVTSWVQRNRTYANKILAGTAAEIMAIFKKQGITITIDKTKPESLQQLHSDWSETWNQLCDFKKRRLPMVNEASVDHDVTQYYLTEAFLPRNSLAEWPKYLITTDRILVRWLRTLHSERHMSEYIPFITVSKITMYLWVKKQKRNHHFIANTWMYVSTSLRLFANPKFNAVYRLLEQEFYAGKQDEDPRSFYLMVKDRPDIDEIQNERDSELILEYFEAIGKDLRSDSKRELEQIKAIAAELKMTQQQALEDKAALERLSLAKNQQLTEKERELAIKDERLRSTQDEADKLRTRNIDLEQVDRFPIRIGLIRLLQRVSHWPLVPLLIKLLRGS
jgi:hypothetical protein